MQRVLYIVEVPDRSIEIFSIGMKTFQEEIRIVKTCNRKPRQRLHHIRMEVPTVPLFYTLRLGRQRVVIESTWYIGVEFIEIIKIVLCIHQPFGIAEHGNQRTGIFDKHSIEFGKSHVQFRRTPGVQYHDIRFGSTERFGKLFFTRLEVCQRIGNTSRFQLPAQSECEQPLFARRIVTVDKDWMIGRESVEKLADSGLVQIVRRLIYLKEITIGIYFGTDYRERYDDLDVILGGKFRQSLHL